MQINGDLDFQGIGRLIRPLLAATDFPINPSAGELLFKDKKLFICAEVAAGLPFWIQLTQEINTYRHVQNTAALEWNIAHDLNVNTPIIQVYDANGVQILPDEIDASDPNTAVVKFSMPTAGIALVMYGTTVGMPKANSAYTQDFSASQTWVVTHGLGYNPNITCIVDNYVVQPETIAYDSSMQATVTFSTPVAGSVRCI